MDWFQQKTCGRSSGWLQRLISEDMMTANLDTSVILCFKWFTGLLQIKVQLSVQGHMWKTSKSRPQTVDYYEEEQPLTFGKEYDLNCLFSSDESGIFHSLLPKTMHVIWEESCHDRKQSKECKFWISEKLKLLVTGKYAKARCFKYIKIMPCNYKISSNI